MRNNTDAGFSENARFSNESGKQVTDKEQRKEHLKALERELDKLLSEVGNTQDEQNRQPDN